MSPPLTLDIHKAQKEVRYGIVMVEPFVTSKYSALPRETSGEKYERQMCNLCCAVALDALGETLEDTRYSTVLCIFAAPANGAEMCVSRCYNLIQGAQSCFMYLPYMVTRGAGFIS